MSDKKKAFDMWVFDPAQSSYPVHDPHSAWAAWQAATEQSSKEIERLNALVSMQAETLKDSRASFLGLQPDFGGPIASQMGKAIERINTALSASSETVEAWKAKMLEDFIKTLRSIPSIGLSERQFGELLRATKQVKE